MDDDDNDNDSNDDAAADNNHDDDDDDDDDDEMEQVSEEWKEEGKEQEMGQEEELKRKPWCTLQLAKAPHSFWLLLWGHISSVILCPLSRILQVRIPFLIHPENYQILTHVPVHARSCKLCSVQCPRPKNSSLMDYTQYQVGQDLARTRDTKAQKRKRTTGDVTAGTTGASILSCAIVFPPFIDTVLFNSANPVDVGSFVARIYDFANQKLYHSEHSFIKNVSVLKDLGPYFHTQSFK